MAEHAPRPFRVEFSGSVRGEIKRLGALAVELDLDRAFVADLKAVYASLHSHPLTWGDPLFRCRNSPHLVAYHRAYRLFSVDYIADESRQFVYVRGIRFMPSDPRLPS